MTTTPEPKTVREIARTFLTDPDADELDYVVRSYIGYASGAEHQAWRDAVRADADDAEVVTIASWPDERTSRPAADLAHAAEDVREHLALRDRAVNDEVLDNPDVLAVARADGHGHALTVSVVRTLLAERDALATYVDGRLAAGQDGDLGAWLTARQADVEHDHDRPGMTPASCYCGLPQPCEQRADDMAAIEQLRAILGRRAELVAENARLWEELEAKQPQDDGDVRAVAEARVRLKAWLTGRQAHIHSEISTTNVIAEPRGRTTAAWAIAESDVCAVVAALEARDAKADEQPQDVRDGGGVAHEAAAAIREFLDAWEAERGPGSIRGGNADMPYLFSSHLRAVLAEREQLRPEFGIRTTRISTEMSEEPVSDNLDDALALIAAAEAKGRPGVLSREPVQREVSEWHGIGGVR